MKLPEQPLRDQPGWWALNASLIALVAIGGAFERSWAIAIGGGIMSAFGFARAYLMWKADNAKKS